MSTPQLHRRSAVVTGASRGIGEEVARRLASAGYDLTITARSTDALAALSEELTDSHQVRVGTVSADMAVEDDVRSIAAAHRDAHGSLDVLVLNAGMGAIGPVADYPVRRLDKMFDINVRSAFVLIQELLPLLTASGASSPLGGKVLAVASMTGIAGEPLNSAYGATKAALISLCETLNTEHALEGVTATAVCPGYVATAMTQGLAETVPLDTMLPVADVATALMALTTITSRTVVPQLVLTRPGPHLWRA